MRHAPARRPRFAPARAAAPVATAAALAVACALGAGLAPASGAHGQPHATAAFARLQVIQVEYRLRLSRGTVRAGALGLEAIDRGTDAHDLRLRRLGSTREVIVPKLGPGQRWDGTLRLRPGVYRLWCSLPEHARRGMRATLRVVR